MNVAFSAPPPIPHATRAGLHDLADRASLAPALAPDPLAQSLAGLNRYGGGTVPSWSVAAHSVLVCHLVETPAAKAWALLHDAHEIIIGDITRPAELLLERLTPGAGIRRAIQAGRDYLDQAVREVWQLEHLTLADISKVEAADRLAGNGERLAFFPDPGIDPDDMADAFLVAETMSQMDLPTNREDAARLAIRQRFIERELSVGLFQ